MYIILDLSESSFCFWGSNFYSPSFFFQIRKETLDLDCFHFVFVLTCLRNSKMSSFCTCVFSSRPLWMLPKSWAFALSCPALRQSCHLNMPLCKMMPVEIQMCLVQFPVYFSTDITSSLGDQLCGPRVVKTHGSGGSLKCPLIFSLWMLQERKNDLALPSH